MDDTVFFSAKREQDGHVQCKCTPLGGAVQGPGATKNSSIFPGP
jgi:hypothetical protein